MKQKHEHFNPVYAGFCFSTVSFSFVVGRPCADRLFQSRLCGIMFFYRKRVQLFLSWRALVSIPSMRDFVFLPGHEMRMGAFGSHVSIPSIRDYVFLLTILVVMTAAISAVSIPSMRDFVFLPVGTNSCCGGISRHWVSIPSMQDYLFLRR